MPSPAPLPPGVSCFAALRAENRIHVDKTGQIRSPARCSGKMAIIGPERFGATLVLFTFEPLFAHGLRDFKALRIESHRTGKTCHTVRMDFSQVTDFKDAGEFSGKFQHLILKAFEPPGLTYEPDGPCNFFLQLPGWFKRLPVHRPVLLIDNCDAPLPACRSDPALFEQMPGGPSGLFALTKRHSGIFRFSS